MFCTDQFHSVTGSYSLIECSTCKSTTFTKSHLVIEYVKKVSTRKGMDAHKKDDEDAYYTFPFQNLEVTSVLQETREFNNTPIKPKHCVLIITKLLYLMGQGKHFSTKEATDAFFNCTKLFITEDVGISSAVLLLLLLLVDCTVLTICVVLFV